MVTTWMAALDIGAKRRQEWLYDICQMARDSIKNNARETFVDAWHPIAYGMPTDAAAFFINSPAFAVGRRANRFDDEPGPEPAAPDNLHVVAEYPSRDLLMSGWMLGERVIAGRAAVIEASVDKGHLVLLGFRSEHRGQTHGTYKLLFNAILLGASERASAGQFR